MKKNISITMDAEKLSALTMFLEQKNQSLDDEVSKALEVIYQKTVPQHVREFIDMKQNSKKKE